MNIFYKLFKGSKRKNKRSQRKEIVKNSVNPYETHPYSPYDNSMPLIYGAAYWTFDSLNRKF